VTGEEVQLLLNEELTLGNPFNSSIASAQAPA
jgi:hypothetical protein